jgi:hypothetical protein
MAFLCFFRFLLRLENFARRLFRNFACFALVLFANAHFSLQTQCFARLFVNLVANGALAGELSAV